jgi:hypothetical protein
MFEGDATVTVSGTNCALGRPEPRELPLPRLGLTLLETASVSASWTFFGIFDAGVGDIVSRGGWGTA